MAAIRPETTARLEGALKRSEMKMELELAGEKVARVTVEAKLSTAHRELLRDALRHISRAMSIK